MFMLSPFSVFPNCSRVDMGTCKNNRKLISTVQNFPTFHRDLSGSAGCFRLLQTISMGQAAFLVLLVAARDLVGRTPTVHRRLHSRLLDCRRVQHSSAPLAGAHPTAPRSEEHTSE